MRISMLFIATTFLLLTATAPVFAALDTVNLQIPIGTTNSIKVCTGDKTTLTCDGIAVYIVALYQFLITAAAIFAVMMLVLGGLAWLSSAGEQKRIAQAQKFIQDALVGLVLILGSHTLLAAINPNLVAFPGFTLGKIATTNLEVADAEDEPGTYEDGDAIIGKGFLSLPVKPRVNKDIEAGVMTPTLKEVLKHLDTLGQFKIYISNMKTGHSPGSRHALGQAVDIHGKTPEDLVKAAQKIWDNADKNDIAEFFLGLDGAPGAILSRGPGVPGQVISIEKFKTHPTKDKKTGELINGYLWRQHSGSSLHLHIGTVR